MVLMIMFLLLTVLYKMALIYKKVNYLITLSQVLLFTAFTQKKYLTI